MVNMRVLWRIAFVGDTGTSRPPLRTGGSLPRAFAEIGVLIFTFGYGLARIVFRLGQHLKLGLPLITKSFAPLRQSGSVASALLPIVRRNYLPSLFVNYAASVAVTILVLSSDVTWVWWWLGVVTVVSLARVGIHAGTGGQLTAASDPDGSRADRQILIAGMGMLAGAACWAVLAWLVLAEPDLLVKYSISIILAGMAAGAVGVLSPFGVIGPLYIATLMVPGAVRLLTLPDAGPVIGGLALIFTGVMMLGHRANRILLLQSVELGQRNSELMAQVMEANQTLENKVRERTETLQHQASRDLLTGLLNRRGLNERFAQRRDAAFHAHAYFIDLNRFKRINDTLGHEAGDYVLREVATRLGDCLPPDAMIARWGGDELIVVMPVTDGGCHVAQELMGLFRAPFAFYGQTLDVSASIGVACCPEDAQGLEELIWAADLAANQAKRLNSLVPCRYDRSLAAALQRREQIADDIVAGVELEQFWLAFQPIVNSGSGDLMAFEALLRWDHPTLGVLPPDEFIAIAEESNHIAVLGAWVLDRACAVAAGWHKSGVRAAVAVNFSIRQLAQPDAVGIVRAALERHGLAARWLHIEVTESVFLPTSDAQMLQVLQQLDGLGIRLAIDDFGTGYSSLARLRDFPMHQIKIDKSFIADIDGKSRSVIEGAALIARRFDLEIVAEGVETVEQATALLSLGIDCFQGFLVGRPVETPQTAVNSPWLLSSKAAV